MIEGRTRMRHDGRLRVRLKAVALWGRLAVMNRSQNWLAREIGITPSYLSMLVNGVGIVEGRPKSAASNRVVSLAGVALDVLAEHREEQWKMLAANDLRWTVDRWLFCNEHGNSYNPSSFTHAFKRMARRIGLDDARLHDARHGHATILLVAESHPKVVQDRLGHSTISTTMDIYSHVLRDLDQGAADAFAA